MKDLKQADRGISMKQQYKITDFPKSGFPLVYNSHVGGLVMGRLIPASYQYIMSGDKFSGRNEFSLIAEQLSTPVVSDVNVSQHNYFVTFRSIDRGFEELQTPTKNNAMSSNLSVPQFKLIDIVRNILITFQNFLPTVSKPQGLGQDVEFQGMVGSTFAAGYQQIRSSAFVTAAKKHYMDDVYEDLIEQIKTLEPAYQAAGTSDEYKQFYVQVWQIILDFFCGEGSLMDYFGMPIVQHEDVEQLVGLWESNLGLKTSAFSSVSILSILSGTYELVKFAQPIGGVTLGIDERLIWEYPLRAYYAIWYEHYRNMWLEPRTSDLMDYKDWGSTSLFVGATLTTAIGVLLPMRCRPWVDDPFTTSQIDDMARHVYAPIIDVSNSNAFSRPSIPAQQNVDNLSDARGNLWSETGIEYVDSFGATQVIYCPLPDALSGMDSSYSRLSYSSEDSKILDLFTLKKAHMLERFLKRNLAFGDEYRDRVKAHYGVTIEDYRINRPHYLSGSVDSVDIKQEVANTGAKNDSNVAGIVKQGDRLATATATSGAGGDGFTFFATEFGIYINLLSIVPLPQYNHTDPIIFTQKMQDFPIPEFAMQQEDINNASEIYRVGLSSNLVDNKPFGHVPYAHGWRYRIDEVHGQMLSSKFDYTFARFFRGLTADGVPKLNYQFIHCRPNLPMFVNRILLDGQFYGTLKHNFLVERLLPQPVETI